MVVEELMHGKLQFWYNPTFEKLTDYIPMV